MFVLYQHQKKLLTCRSRYCRICQNRSKIGGL